MSNAIELSYEKQVVETVKVETALSNFNAFLKEFVENITIDERLHILKYQASCLFYGALFIPRITNTKNKYHFTILKLLSAYLQVTDMKLIISSIGKDKIFFTKAKGTIFEDLERIKRLLFSEMISINSIKYNTDNNIQIAVNPIEKTLKLKVIDRYGYSELAFNNFSIKDVYTNDGKEYVIKNAGEWDGKQLEGTISKVDYNFVTGLHHIIPMENQKDVLVYRYQKLAKTLDRFIKYDMKQGIDWDRLLNKSSYNIIG